MDIKVSYFFTFRYRKQESLIVYDHRTNVSPSVAMAAEWCPSFVTIKLEIDNNLIRVYQSVCLFKFRTD